MNNASFLHIYDSCFQFFSLKYMEEHIRMLEALCRICGEKTKGNERKEDVTKYADEVKQI